MWSSLWQSAAGFFGSLLGKALLVGAVLLALFVMKLRLDAANAKLEKSQMQISVLESVNAENRKSFAELQSAFQQQEQALLAYEKERQGLQEKIRQKELVIKKLRDTDSLVWKNTPVPQAVKTVLREE